jgi:hypothetical protein
VKYVLLYEPGEPDMAAKATLHFPEHAATWDSYQRLAT